MVYSNVLTVDEVHVIWSRILNDPAPTITELRDMTLIGWILDTGARPRETALAQWSCVQLLNEDGGFITITPQSAKRGRQRQVAMTARLGRMLDRWVTVQNRNTNHPADSYIFSAEDATVPVTNRTIQRAIGRISKALIGRKLKPYDLRHTFATQLLRVSNLRVVQHALGHRSTSTTQLYTHVQDSDLANGAAAYEAVTTRSMNPVCA